MTDIDSSLGLNSRSLAGKVALVTGAARGIGEHTAYALARCGARVVLADLSEAGRSVAQGIQALGGQAHFVQMDVGDDAGIERLLTETSARFGPVDILINNATQLILGAVLEQSTDLWDSCFRTNVLGPLALIQKTVPGMIARRQGVVISLISLEGMHLMGSYCASKMALRSMMLSLGKEMAPDLGVSVFSVMPGAVETPLAFEMIRSFAKAFGIAEAEVMASMSNNPGYAGLVPVAHTAASLAWFCANAPQFHGQYVDGYLPLSQAGVIDVGGSTATASPVTPHTLPNPALDLKELISINRSLENRITERTRELEAANRRLQEASLTDPLTGLWNRRYADIAMREEVANVFRKPADDDTSPYLVIVDVDHFKQINDAHGHRAGDTVLQEVGNILKLQTRVSDKVIRWGGEEFLVVLKDVRSGEAQFLVERIRSAVAETPFSLDNGVQVHCTCTLGFSALRRFDGPTAMSWEAVVALADSAMYVAKQNGRNCWIGLEVNPAASALLATPISGWNLRAMIGQDQLAASSCLDDVKSIIW